MFNNSDKFLHIYCVYSKVKLKYFLFAFAKSYELLVLVSEAYVELGNTWTDSMRKLNEVFGGSWTFK